MVTILPHCGIAMVKWSPKRVNCRYLSKEGIMDFLKDIINWRRGRRTCE